MATSGRSAGGIGSCPIAAGRSHDSDLAGQLFVPAHDRADRW